MNLREMLLIKQEYRLSYRQISEESGVPLPTVQKVFTGKTKNPRYETAASLAAALAALKRKASGLEVPSHVADSHSQLAPEASAGASAAGTSAVSAAYSPESPSSALLSEAPAQYVWKSEESQAAASVRKPVKKPGEYTIEDYYAWPEEERIELIDGVIYDMSAPTKAHQLLAGEAYRQIANFIVDRGGKCRPYIAPVDVRLDRDNKTMVQPDVIIVCDPSKEEDDRVIYGAPEFVMEVLSPATRLKDLSKKLVKYKTAGVLEYWIVDPYEEMIFVYLFGKERTQFSMYPLFAEIPVSLYEGKLTISFETIRSWLL